MTCPGNPCGPALAVETRAHSPINPQKNIAVILTTSHLGLGYAAGTKLTSLADSDKASGLVSDENGNMTDSYRNQAA